MTTPPNSQGDRPYNYTPACIFWLAVGGLGGVYVHGYITVAVLVAVGAWGVWKLYGELRDARDDKHQANRVEGPAA